MTMFTRSDKTADDKPQNTPEAARAPATPQVRPAAAPPVAAPSAAARAHGTSVIGKAVKITGQIESTEDVQIEGQVEGDVRGQTVTIGANARVKGTVYGETVEVAGTVEGKIEARKVIIAATGHMTGDVIHADIRIESGAFIDGHLRPEHGKDAKAATKSTT
jgi:cytoskeletal protein CcmA (bactofilin family)